MVRERQLLPTDCLPKWLTRRVTGSFSELGRCKDYIILKSDRTNPFSSHIGSQNVTSDHSWCAILRFVPDNFWNGAWLTEPERKYCQFHTVVMLVTGEISNITVKTNKNKKPEPLNKDNMQQINIFVPIILNEIVLIPVCICIIQNTRLLIQGKVQVGKIFR